jgi:predicted type IV restriction endonuclease
MSVPKKIVDRIQSSLKTYQAVLQAQKARDVSEADTVTIVKDLLSDVFGYDKYAELTGEHAIRGTYCDLAVKLDGKLQILIEVKAIGLDLKDSHVKQAVDYASNQGCEWVVLTNAIEWRLYNVLFKKPIDKQEIANIDMLTVSVRNEADLEKLYLLTREGFIKNALADYRARKDATSRFILAAILLNTESVQNAIRREVRRVTEILVDQDTIEKMLREQVIKREAIEGEQAEAAARRVLKSGEKSILKTGEKDATPSTAGEPDATVPTRPPIEGDRSVSPGGPTA